MSGLLVNACYPRTERQRKVDPWELLAKQFSLNSSLQPGKQEIFFKTQSSLGITGKADLCPPHTDAYTCILSSTHTCTNAHMNTTRTHASTQEHPQEQACMHICVS